MARETWRGGWLVKQLVWRLPWLLVGLAIGELAQHFHVLGY